MKLVIADDEPLARERLRALLADHAHVEGGAEAGNGLEALQGRSQPRPDAVLLDIAMPGADGIEAARHLAAFEPRPAVLFCTAYDAHALSAFEVAALDYLMKPIRPQPRPPGRAGPRGGGGRASPGPRPRGRPPPRPGPPTCVRACAAACA